MELPQDIKYTKDHEWVRISGEGSSEGLVATIGITSFAQEELGEIVYVDLPKKGGEVKARGVLCVVESTKAASDVYSPINGVVLESNLHLENQPSLINTSPYNDGWIAKICNVKKEDIETLLSYEEYQKLIKGH